MSRKVSSFFILIALIGASAAYAVGPSDNSVAVETFTHTSTYTAPNPAELNADGTSLTLAANMTLNSVTFQAGSVNYLGHPVDFSGTESAWLATTFSGSGIIPVHSGPAVVNTTCVGSTTGAAAVSGAGGATGLTLGAAFSASNLDVVNGSNWTWTGSTPNWQSTTVPQLNGHRVTVQKTEHVTSVDAANRIISTSSSGTIYADINKFPALSIWGLVLVTIGLLGSFYLLLRRKTVGGLFPV